MAQLVAGCGVATHLLRRDRWRALRGFVLLLIAAWFVCSGVAELIVSGMEAAHTLGGFPPVTTLALWRGRVDRALVVVTVVLALCLLVSPLLRRLPSGK
ncbi:MAG: hypothetical protein ACHQ4H_08545 [Ktedonobacterales bacterium]